MIDGFWIMINIFFMIVAILIIFYAAYMPKDLRNKYRSKIKKMKSPK